jgi:hypothetical protein
VFASRFIVSVSVRPLPGSSRTVISRELIGAVLSPLQELVA